MRMKKRQEPKEKTYSERELRKFFSMQSELKDRLANPRSNRRR